MTRVQEGFNNFGAGAQHNNSGTGNQNNNSGLGTQYNAASINFVNKEKDNFLADLRVTDPRDDKTRIERTKGNLLKDSYRWILDHNDFRRWRAEKRLLWIKGGPGKGKTMLLCGVIDELIAMGYESTFFFFCQAADARLSTAASVLRGLLYLILYQSPILLSMLRSEYDRAGVGKQLFEDTNSWEVLCRMLLTAVRHESLQGAVIVIDGLDECTAGLDQLISFIIDMTAHVKIITSSRPELRIDRGLGVALEDTKVYLTLELNEDAISAAVDNYIDHKVHQLARMKGYDDQTKVNIQEYFSANANHTFLWVALVYDQLADNRVAKRHTQQKLREFPPGLDSLYKRILDLILSSIDGEDCKEVLAVMSIVSRPLDLVELASLLDHIQCSAEIVDECGSLLNVRENVIYFVHQSAKDFLIRQADRIMPSGVALQHGLVLSKLLQSMSNTLRRNVYDIDQHGIAVEDISVPYPDPLACVRYACVYWADHFMDNNLREEQFQNVHSFLTQHFLHWVEALSLLRSISEGISSMYRVQKIIEASTASPDRRRLVHDAVRFLRFSRTGIEFDPVQVYLSALVFSPTASHIRRLFRIEEPKWTVKCVVDEDWSPCLQTLEGHASGVNSVDISPNQALLASGSGRCVMLWSIITGHCVRIFEPPGRVQSVAFSPDGSMLALTAGFYIQLWHTVTGHCVRTLSPDFTPLSVAVSADGAMLASGSHKDIQLWDINSGRCIDALSIAASSVALSGDGSLLVSAWRDKDVKLWHTSTGICFEKIDHSGWITSLALSDDGTHLAIGSHEGMKMCNLTTNDCFGPQIQHGSRVVRSVAISHDGTQLAFGHGRTVYLWDVASNRRKRTLRGHHDDVESVALSKDGSLLASGSTDSSVKLWDLTEDQSHSSSETASSDLDSLFELSSHQEDTNYEKVIFFRSDLSVTMRKQEHTLGTGLTKGPNLIESSNTNPYNDKIHSICFARDGSRAISISRRTTAVWDTTNGQCLRTMQSGSFPQPGCSATILNGDVHIAAVFGCQIAIRDECTGKLLRTLEARPSENGVMIISHEGRSGRSLFDVRVDDPKWERVRFSASGYKLLTNFGTIDLNSMGSSSLIPGISSPPPRPQVYRYTQKDPSWIWKDERRFLWLPAEYRPDVAETYGSIIAMGLKSGRFGMIRFS